MNSALNPPSPLDNTKIHSPAEVRAWKAAHQAYFEQIRQQEIEARQAVEQVQAHANRFLTEEEYHQLALEREAAKKEKELMGEVVEAAAERAKQDWLASSPETVELLDTNPVAFVMNIVHWAKKGHAIDETALIDILPTYFRLTMIKSQTKKAKHENPIQQ